MPRRGTLLRSGQYDNCAKRDFVSSTEAKSIDLCRARMRRNEQAENESTILHMIRVAPWRRGAPKAEDRCASKRHPSTQRLVCQVCKALLRIVISSEARNLCHSRLSGQCLEIPNGKPAIHLPSGIAPYILQRSCHHNPEP